MVSVDDGPDDSARPQASILIVDDSASKRLALTAVLTPLGQRIVEAKSGRAALRCVMREQFAVILLDIRMPSMNGFETAAAIRMRVQSEFTPIIFITAHAGDEIDPMDVYAAGAADVITAPVRPEDLRGKVSVFVNLFLQSEARATGSIEAESERDGWRLLLDVAPVGLYRTDAQHRIVDTNEQWTTMTGIARSDAAGRTLEDLFGPGAMVDPGPGGLAGDVRRRFRLGPADGIRMLEMTARRIPDALGPGPGWVGTLTDVSAATERSTPLPPEAADTLRAPMTLIVGLVETMLADVASSDGPSHVDP